MPRGVVRTWNPAEQVLGGLSTEINRILLSSGKSNSRFGHRPKNPVDFLRECFVLQYHLQPQCWTTTYERVFEQMIYRTFRQRICDLQSKVCSICVVFHQTFWGPLFVSTPYSILRFFYAEHKNYNKTYVLNRLNMCENVAKLTPTCGWYQLGIWQSDNLTMKSKHAHLQFLTPCHLVCEC